MIKKMIVPALAMMVFSTASFAQASSEPARSKEPTPVTKTLDATTGNVAKPEASVAAQDQKEEKVQVEISALPEGVQKALSTDAYKDWKPTTAWHVKGATEYYVVELKKGEETTKVKLDASGKQVG